MLDRLGASDEHRGDQRPKSVTLLARSATGAELELNSDPGLGDSSLDLAQLAIWFFGRS